MPHFSFCAFVLVVAPALLDAQVSTGSNDIFRIGPGVTPPRVLHKVEPEYSPSARADRVQGTVFLEVVINEKGRTTDIAVISPLGFGLDEKAQAAVEKWEFAPGIVDGKPVKILATVEVNFRFPNLWFDEKTERQRTLFNVVLQNLNRVDASSAAVERDVKSMQELARKRYPPAMYMIGIWETKGDYVSKNSEDGLALIQKAAAKKYGPALYEIAIRRIDGRDLPKDIDKGLEDMREAAILGSPLAQFYLGSRYQKGDGVPRDVDRARQYFRLCAVHRVAMCQYKLGRLLLDATDRPERDYVQAVALFRLAAEQGLQEANDIASREALKLTPVQNKWVDSVKAQLVRK
jgi:TonB family protein